MLTKTITLEQTTAVHRYCIIANRNLCGDILDQNISNQITLPTMQIPGIVEQNDFTLISLVQHIDYLNTGNTGHFFSHVLHGTNFFKVDGMKPIVKSTMQELKNSSVFMYKKKITEMFD